MLYCDLYELLNLLCFYNMCVAFVNMLYYMYVWAMFPGSSLF